MGLKISIKDTENWVELDGAEMELGDLLRWEDDGGSLPQQPDASPASIS